MSWLYKVNLIYQPHFQRIIKYMSSQIIRWTVINYDLLWSMNGSCCTEGWSYRSTNKSCFDYEVKRLQLNICLVDEANQFCFLTGRYLTIPPSLQGQGDAPHQTGPRHQPAAAPAEPDTCEDHTINQLMFSQILSKIKDGFKMVFVFLPVVFLYV